MSDPVLEAAQRAWDSAADIGVVGGTIIDSFKVAVMAAREMADSLKELHKPFDRRGLYDPSGFGIVCNHCHGPMKWPCATARLIYSAEELS